MKVKLGLTTQPLIFTTVNEEVSVNIDPGANEIYGDRDSLLFLVFESTEDYLEVINDKNLYDSEKCEFDYSEFASRYESIFDDLPDGGDIFENCEIESVIIYYLSSGNKAYELVERG